MPGPAGGAAATILNVDDDETGRRVLTQALQKAGFEVREASTAGEALERIKEGPCLVLLDADPLVDIHNTTKIAAVVANGRLLPRRELDRLLADVEAASKK